MIGYRVRRAFNGGSLGDFRVGATLDAEVFLRIPKVNRTALVSAGYVELRDDLAAAPVTTAATHTPSKNRSKR